MRGKLATAVVVVALALSGCAAADGMDDPGSSGTSPQDSPSQTPSQRSTSESGGGQDTSGSSDEKAQDTNGSDDEKTTDESVGGPDGDIPKSCDVSRKQVLLVARDWERVVGSIDRDDHGKYTGAFVKRIDRVNNDSGSCPGSEELDRIKAVATKIDRQVAKDGTAPLSEYPKVVTAGEDWLSSLGFDNVRLAAG